MSPNQKPVAIQPTPEEYQLILRLTPQERTKILVEGARNVLSALSSPATPLQHGPLVTTKKAL